jgi:hypothetical protein
VVCFGSAISHRCTIIAARLGLLRDRKKKGDKTMKSKGITAKGINWPRGWRPSEDADWILVKP